VCLLRGTDWIFIYNSTFCPHSVFVCFVWLWEQTAIISPYNIDWFYNQEGEFLLRGTDWIFIYNSTFCPHSVFMCFVWIWEQTATISLYSNNWLVFITERECVYCAVRTGYLYIILRSAHTVYLCVLCGSENKQRLFPYTTLTGFYNQKGVCLLRGTDWIFIYNSTFCPHSVFMCFVWIWEQTAIISLYSINWQVFITETECVYCAVRTGSLYIILRSAHTVHLCVLCGSENKQRLFPYTACAGLSLWCRRDVFTKR